MFKRIRFTFLAVFTALAVTSFYACDMTYVNRGRQEVKPGDVPFLHPDDDGDVNDPGELEQLERTGRFLKLTSMPAHTQGSNVVSVQIANSVSTVAGLDKNQKVRIFRDKNSASVYLPLAYPDNSEFAENGSFYVAFSVHVDAVSSYVITVNDKILVPFTDGRGELDVKTLPFIGIVATDRRYLTIYNLPLNLLPQNVSNVSVNNRSGPVAVCADYSVVDVSSFGGSCTVSIPLSSANSPRSAPPFSGTGSFYVAFELFIDVLTHYTVAAEDQVLVYFLNGNGFLDINEIETAAAARRRYLTLTNLPPNLLPRHVSNVMLYNQTGPIARVEDYGLIKIVPSQGDTASARVPLYYVSPPGVFYGTGDFIIVFDINVDANTRYTVTAGNRVAVSFLDGNGSFDAAKIPVPEHRYLTVTHLPSSLLARNVSGVMIHNMSGPVAQCEDYGLLEISLSGGYASVRVPLSFISPPSMFTGTGNFTVSFNINVDADTGYVLAAGDNVKVSFANGNGTFNINDIPVKPVPCLTIRNLPLNTVNLHIKDVCVYNLAGPVAKCEDSKSISTFAENGRVTAKIPLISDSGKDYFQDTGLFYVSFTVNVDIENQIIIGPADNVALNFTGGYASLDLFSTYGYFSAELANPSDSARPVIKSGAEFDVDGFRHRVSSDLIVPADPPANFSGVLYLYAYRVYSDVFYEFSPAAPSFNAAKNGHYNGYKRALWKMVYLYDVKLFLFKTYVAENFPQFANSVLTAADFNTVTSSKTPYYSLSGSPNPKAAELVLPPGVYAVRLDGAGGGGGYGSTYGDAVTGSSSGGNGGSVTEIFTVNAASSFTAFTGSGGSVGTAPASAGGFLLYGYKNGYKNSTPNTGFNPVPVPTNDLYAAYIPSAGSAGGGGGGGGSGTFLYSPALAGASHGYFLCAGGGGGGSGGSSFTPGGGGGSGGTIGPGAGGGSGGALVQSYNSTNYWVLAGGGGGKGGGSDGGPGGTVAPSVLASNVTSSGGSRADPFSPSSFAIPGVHIGHYKPNDIDLGPVLNLITPDYSLSPGVNGGSAPTVKYLSGPDSWRSANNAADSGKGASAPAVGQISFSDFFTVIEIGSYNYGNNYITCFTDYWSLFLISAVPRSGLAGPHGGNNRNDATGGGAAGGRVTNYLPTGGAGGSVSIYKIH